MGGRFRIAVVMVLVAAALVSAGGTPAQGLVNSHLTCDIDGDGYGDLVVGIPGEDIGSAEDAGAVQVIFGSSAGLTSAGNVVFGQNHPGIPGGHETDDAFGRMTECGDFNGDGYDEVVVGVPNEDVGTRENAGLVVVVPGTSSGLDLNNAFNIHQGTPGVPGAVEAGDLFGLAVAPGDFDGDGYEDLAVGAGGEALGSIDAAGLVHVFYGSADGLVLSGSDSFTQSSAGIAGVPEANDFFGSEFTTGDLDSDGYEDLVLGLPHEDIGSAVDAGAVTVMWGSASGVSGVGSSSFTQNSASIPGGAEAGDQFGEAIAVYERPEPAEESAILAVGVPYEDIGGVVNVGMVQEVTFPDRSVAGQIYHLASSAGIAHADHLNYGLSLATQHTPTGSLEHVMTSAPGYEAQDSQFIYPFAGSVVADLHRENGHGRAYSHEDVLPYPEAGAFFGNHVLSNDFDGDGVPDLVGGAPGFDFSGDTLVGLVTVIDGADRSVSQRWHQDRPGIAGAAEGDDLFGFLGGNP